MSGRYKLVHYVPNPFTDTRFAVGAFVEAEGRFPVEVAEQLPDAACLGGKMQLAALKMMLSSLSRSGDFSALPQSVGPYASLSEARKIPDGVEDSRAWICRHLDGPGARPTKDKGSSRRTAGSHFFRKSGVSECVHNSFRPAKSHIWGPRLSEAVALKSVSHWVEGPGQLWLLEPIIVAENQLTKEIPKVAQLLGAYRMLTDRHDLAGGVRLVAYMLGQGNEALRRKTVAELAPFATSVVDTSLTTECQAFVAGIRQVAGYPAPLS